MALKLGARLDAAIGPVIDLRQAESHDGSVFDRNQRHHHGAVMQRIHRLAPQPIAAILTRALAIQAQHCIDIGGSQRADCIHVFFRLIWIVQRRKRTGGTLQHLASRQRPALVGQNPNREASIQSTWVCRVLAFCDRARSTIRACIAAPAPW